MLTNRRALVATIACLAALAAGVSLAFAATSGNAASRTYVQVSAREFYFGLSKTKVKPGRATFELVNYGEDDHDMALRRVGNSAYRRMDVVAPGERGRLNTKLRRGTYLLWCTIADHRERGMRAKLKVRR